METASHPRVGRADELGTLANNKTDNSERGDNNIMDLQLRSSSKNSKNSNNNNKSQQQQQDMQSLANRSIKNKKLFPQKLWDLIHDRKYNFCLRWSDDGQLVYLNRDEFEDSYLKTDENQFHTQKAISFVRQMNMYGFRKVDDCYYENDNFKRHCEHLLKNMTRKHPIKSASGSSSAATSVLTSGHHFEKRCLSTTTQIVKPLLFKQHPSAPTGVSLLAPKQANFHHPATDYSLPPRDLSTSASSNQSQHLATTQDDSQRQQANNSNLNAFYALLSSINNNLYQPSTHLLPQSDLRQQEQSNLVYDTNTRFSNIQQIYQHLTAAQQQQQQQQQDTSIIFILSCLFGMNV